MTRYCLDTSTYSQFRRGIPPVVDLVTHADWVGLPVTALAELLAGFLTGARREWNEARLNEFLASPQVEILVADELVGRHYARLYADLRRVGRPIPHNDLWIAATAARYDTTLLTYDRHFASITSLDAVILQPPR